MWSSMIHAVERDARRRSYGQTGHFGPVIENPSRAFYWSGIFKNQEFACITIAGLKERSPQRSQAWP
jgi:hypothetical protein